MRASTLVIGFGVNWEKRTERLWVTLYLWKQKDEGSVGIVNSKCNKGMDEVFSC